MFDFTEVSGEKLFKLFTDGLAYVADFDSNGDIGFQNVGRDNIDVAGFYTAPCGGTIKGSKYSFYNGGGSPGEGVSLDNHMAINEGYIPNP